MNIQMRDFIVQFSNDRVLYDEAFQRRGDCWSRSTKNRLLVNLFKDKAHSVLVVADVRKCWDYSRRVGAPLSEERFSDIVDAGYDYISLDGQNRTKAILEFFDNKTTITGKFEDAFGDVHDLDNCYYKDVPATLAPIFLTRSIGISVETNSVYSDFSYLFRDLNNGEPCNEQELRSSYNSPVARWVRKTQKNFIDSLKRCLKESGINRMADDQLVAKFAVHLVRKYSSASRLTSPMNLDHPSLDAFYQAGEGVAELDSVGSPYLKEEFDRAFEIIKMLCRVLDKQNYYTGSRLIAMKMVWASLFMCEWAYDNNYEITDHKELFDLIKKIDDRLIRESDKEYHEAREQKIEEGEDAGEIQDTKYYFKWVGLPHIKEQRMRRKAKFCETIEEHISTHGPSATFLASARRRAA